MPKGIPRAGFRRTKRYKTKSLQELEKDIADKAPYIVEELEKLTRPFPCPRGQGTGKAQTKARDRHH
jgi:hypothetical protein